MDVIEKLRAENERLRGDLDTFIHACEELHDIPAEDEILRLEKENERLRKLVIAHSERTEAVYQYWAGDGTREQLDAILKCNIKVNKLSKELGIEVTDI